jgi:hypothetical protein
MGTNFMVFPFISDRDLYLPDAGFIAEYQTSRGIVVSLALSDGGIVG